MSVSSLTSIPEYDAIIEGEGYCTIKGLCGEGARAILQGQRETRPQDFCPVYS